MKCLPVAVSSIVSMLLLACVPAANAVSRDITAIFRPDASKPHENVFLNTTPIGGYCQHQPTVCEAKKLSSILLPVTFDSTGPIQANHTDPRKGAMLSVPTQWRELQVIHSETGETETVEFRWAGIGATYRLPVSAPSLVGGGVSNWTAHGRLWGGKTWQSAPAPCQEVGFIGYSDKDFPFIWWTPTDGVCAKKASYAVPSLKYLSVNFAYELRTPNPLKMSSGRYTGSLNYTIGPGQDFDAGDVMIPTDSLLTLNFKLDVEHTLKVEVPPGGNRVELVPQEGWQAWLNSGSKPTRLFRDQRFHISASSRFKMRLECQYVSGNTCAISETGSGHTVPVDVRVSLPEGLADVGGQPVDRRPLLRDGSGTELFQPSVYVDRRSGMLHFEVARGSVEEMLDTGAKAYSGSVTVIWDSEV